MKQGSSDDPFAEDLEEDEDRDEASELDSSSQNTSESSLPWKFRRENARDGRPKTKQIHLQKETARQETTFRSEVEDLLDEDIELTDLREAALLVAMNHVDEVADQLREWGYDFD